MDIEQFCKLRPRLYHLTAASNVESIRQHSELVSASVVFQQADRTGDAHRKRFDHVTVRYRGKSIHMRDQRPLHARNCAMAKGMAFGDVVKMLNDRVFFWPGDARGPIDYGRRHFQRYADESCRVLVIPTRDVIEANLKRQPQFCLYNSGSPRCTSGRGSPRGRQTFLMAAEFEGTPGKVREVVWVEQVKLPESMRVTSARRWL